jgi:hypothetical protein
MPEGWATLHFGFVDKGHCSGNEQEGVLRMDARIFRKSVIGSKPLLIAIGSSILALQVF